MKTFLGGGVNSLICTVRARNFNESENENENENEVRFAPWSL